MTNQFTCKSQPTIQFGVGCIRNVTDLVKPFGSRLLVLTGDSSLKRGSIWHKIMSSFTENGFAMVLEEVKSEPTPRTVDDIVRRNLPAEVDALIAIGGGSVLDTGKAVSAMLPAGESVLEFLEGVGTRVPDGRKIPFIAAPTTAGTGSEATSNAVISRSGVDGFKKSLRHDNYIPNVALIDPDLMRSCPPELTAACGMDTFTQLVEAFLSTQASLFTDALAWSGIEAVQRSLAIVYENGDNIQARSDMAYASLCSGIVLSNAGLGITHGMAPPLGSLFPIPHGAVCGTLMAASNEVTLKHLQKTGINSEAIAKYVRLGKLCSTADKRSNDYYMDFFITELYKLTELLRLPRLSDYGATYEDIDVIVSLSGNKNNPAPLSGEEMAEILSRRM